MDVGLKMKIIFPFFLIIFTFNVNAETLKIFNLEMKLIDDCKIEYQKSDEIKVIDLKFKNMGVCEISTFPNTNVPKLVYVNGMYVFIVESMKYSKNLCRAQYKGIGVSRNNLPVISILRRTGTCGSDKEIHEYEYLVNRMKKDKN